MVTFYPLKRAKENGAISSIFAVCVQICPPYTLCNESKSFRKVFGQESLI